MLDSPIKNLLIPDFNSENNNSNNSGAGAAANPKDLLSTPKLPNPKPATFDFVYAGLSENSAIAEGFLGQKAKKSEPISTNIKVANQPQSSEPVSESKLTKNPADKTQIKTNPKLELESNLRTNSSYVPDGLYSELQQDYKTDVKDRNQGIANDWERLIRQPILRLWEDFVFEIKDYGRWLRVMIARPRVVTLIFILMFAVPFLYYPQSSRYTKTSDNNSSKVSELNLPKIENPLDSTSNFWGDVGSNFNNVARGLPTFGNTNNISLQPDPRITIDLNNNLNTSNIVDNLSGTVQDFASNNINENSLINTKKTLNISPNNAPILTTTEGDIEFSDNQSEIFVSSSFPANTLVIIDYNGVRSNAIVSPPANPLPAGIIGIANRTTREKLSQSSNQQQTINNLNRIKVKIIPE